MKSRRKSSKPKRRNAPTAARRRGSAAAAPETEVARLNRELHEALEQQAATSEVLRVISSSPGDLQPVFSAVLKAATGICGAKFGVLFRFEGGSFHTAALLDVPPAFADFLARQGAFAPQPGRLFGRVSQTKKVIRIDDRATEPDLSPSARYGGARSSIAVPMLKNDELVGCFFIYRRKCDLSPTSRSSWSRISRPGRHRHREHPPAQRAARIAAAADRHCRRAQGDQPLDLRSAGRARHAGRVGCPAVRRRYREIWRPRGASYHLAAGYGVSSKYQSVEEQRLSRERRHRAGSRIDRRPDPARRTHRSYATMSIPIRNTIWAACRLSATIGRRSAFRCCARELRSASLSLTRTRVAPFTQQQIDLVTTFADQAVIAIENVRLYEEVQARTEDLSESLEQQTAMSEVLRVISSSPPTSLPCSTPSDQRDAALRRQFRRFVAIRRRDAVRVAAMHNVPPGFAQFCSEYHRSGSGRMARVIGRSALRSPHVQVADVDGRTGFYRRSSSIMGGFRTLPRRPAAEGK